MKYLDRPQWIIDSLRPTRHNSKKEMKEFAKKSHIFDYDPTPKPDFPNGRLVVHKRNRE